MLIFETFGVFVIKSLQTASYSSLKSKPIIAPVTGGAFQLVNAFNGGPGSEILAPVKNYFTYGDYHPYPQFAQTPESAERLENYLTQAIDPRGWPGKPLVVTETGYHTATNCDRSASADDLIRCLYKYPVSEKVQSKYHSRILAYHFKVGIQRTYLYQFIDNDFITANNVPEEKFGLLGLDTPKPADGNPWPRIIRKPTYNAVKNLISVLKDPGASFVPKRLDYTVTSSPSTGPLGVTCNNLNDICTLLLQKRSGKFYLLTWLNLTGKDAQQYKNYKFSFATAPRTIRSNFPGSNVVWTPITQSGAKEYSLKAYDQLRILEITP